MPGPQARQNKDKKRRWKQKGYNSQYALKSFLIKLGVHKPFKLSAPNFSSMVFMGTGITFTADAEL